MEQNLWLPFARLYFSLVLTYQKTKVSYYMKVSYYTFRFFDIWDPFNVLLSQSQSYFSTWITVDTHCITKTYDDVIMMSSMMTHHHFELTSSSRAIWLVHLCSTLFFQILFSMLSTNNPIGSSRKPTTRSFLPIWAPLRHLGKIFEKWLLEIWHFNENPYKTLTRKMISNSEIIAPKYDPSQMRCRKYDACLLTPVTSLTTSS